MTKPNKDGTEMLELNKIYNMDCLEGLKQIDDNSVDLIVTDPPYNIGDDNKRTKIGNKIMSNKEAWGEWDHYDKDEYDIFFINYLKECYRILKLGAVMYCFSAREDNGFFTRKAVEIGFTYLNTLSIVKKNPLPHFTKTNYRSAFELCFYVCKGDKPKTFNFISQQECVNTFYYLIGIKESEHPTEKPINFIRRCIQISSKEGDLVFDGFMGSGTTAIAKGYKQFYWF
jgi:site-specific DNA-methyltransferase (adenine-specific)